MISNSIKRVMVGEAVRGIKKTVLDIKVMVEFTLSDGGCSFQFLCKLVDFSPNGLVLPSKESKTRNWTAR